MPRSPTPPEHVRSLTTITAAASLLLLACSSSSSNADGAIGGSSGSDARVDAAAETGGGRAGDTGTAGSTGNGGGGGAIAGIGGGPDGSSGGAAGAGGKGEVSGSGGRGGAAGGAGAQGTPCGSTGTCSAGQVCVHPSCGGGTASCERMLDGGQCPSGWTYTGSCASSGGPGCEPPPCTPPAAYCADVPSACSGSPTCSCLPANVCTENGGSGGCQFTNGSDVSCGSA